MKIQGHDNEVDPEMDVEFEKVEKNEDGEMSDEEINNLLKKQECFADVLGFSANETSALANVEQNFKPIGNDSALLCWERCETGRLRGSRLLHESQLMWLSLFFRLGDDDNVFTL